MTLRDLKNIVESMWVGDEADPNNDLPVMFYNRKQDITCYLDSDRWFCNYFDDDKYEITDNVGEYTLFLSGR